CWGPALARDLPLVSRAERRGRGLPCLCLGFWAIAVLFARPANNRPVGRATWGPGSLVDRDAAFRGARPSEPRLARLSGSTRRPRITRGLIAGGGRTATVAILGWRAPRTGRRYLI